MSENINENLAYLKGILDGDGYLIKQTSGGYMVSLLAKDKIFVDSFIQVLKDLGYKTNMFFSKNDGISGCWRGYTYSKELFYKCKDIKINTLEEWIKYIKGFYESEGWLDIRNYYYRKGNKFSRKTPAIHLRMSNNNKQLIEKIKTFLEKIQFHPKLYIYNTKKNKDHFILSLYRKREVKRFLKLILPCIKGEDYYL